MALVKLSRGAEVQHQYVNGVSQVPVLVGAYKEAAVERVSIQPGADYTPATYAKTEHNQVFLVTAGAGYIKTPRRVYNITEVSVFVPDFDRESFTFHCAADCKENMEIVHFVTELSDYDHTCLKESHLSLPRFRGVSEAWRYNEKFHGDIVQKMLIEHRNLGRLSMGANFGSGPNFIGQHIHNELEQWYIMLPGTSFTYTAEDEKIHLEGGDITFTPHGSHHGSECGPDEKFAYVWFELCEQGYPGEIK